MSSDSQDSSDFEIPIQKKIQKTLASESQISEQKSKNQLSAQTAKAIPQTIAQSEMKAQDYYDLQQKQTITGRQMSKLIQLRNFQNWVKAALINEYTQMVKANLPKEKNEKGILQSKLLNICEMGCGKGGDINKWQHAGTGVWFGLDISSEGLKEALNRQQTNKSRIPKLYLMQASANMDSTLFRAQLPQDLYFDFVSMQFMANLLFSSESDVENMFENITSRLANQGLVLMTITDAAVLVKKIRTLGRKVGSSYIYDNQYFSLKFDQLEFYEKWGMKYSFYLEDAVGFKVGNQITYVPEYLIEMQSFKDKAAEYGLELIEDLNFEDFYLKYKSKYNDLLLKMIKPPHDNWTMPDDQWEIAHLYRTVVLRYNKGIPQSKVRRHPNLPDLPSETLQLEK